MPAKDAKACVKRNKNDATDAEAIYAAVRRPTMRFVRVKSAEQQGGRRRKLREIAHTLAHRFSINRYARIHEVSAPRPGRLVAAEQRPCRSGE